MSADVYGYGLQTETELLRLVLEVGRDVGKGMEVAYLSVPESCISASTGQKR